MPTERVTEVLGHIAANVRRLRLRQGLTQAKLAENAGLDLSWVQRVEKGRTNVGIATLVDLADELEVPPGLLLRAARPLPPSRRGRPPKRRGARSGRGKSPPTKKSRA